MIFIFVHTSYTIVSLLPQNKNNPLKSLMYTGIHASFNLSGVKLRLSVQLRIVAKTMVVNVKSQNDPHFTCPNYKMCLMNLTTKLD